MNERLDSIPLEEVDQSHEMNPDAAAAVEEEDEPEEIAVLDEEEERKQRLWKDSVFAIGLTNPTWKDERISFRDCFNSSSASGSSTGGDNSSGMWLSAWVFGGIAGRVGNMIVLRQVPKALVKLEGMDGPTELPQLKLVLGPFWYVPLFFTIPILVGGSGAVMYITISNIQLVFAILWIAAVSTLLIALVLCSTTDPGILYRYNHAPDDSWVWSDQALTYRPPGAKYDSFCGVVLEKYDHVCPWTGTAIAKRNMVRYQQYIYSIITLFVATLTEHSHISQCYFRVFTAMVPVVIVIDFIALGTIR